MNRGCWIETCKIFTHMRFVCDDLSNIETDMENNSQAII